MADFRIPYGLALGKVNNFFAQTNNVFTSGDATPDVTLGSLFFTSNTSNTSISDFEFNITGPIPGMSAHGSVAGQFEGKIFTLVYLDDSTTLVRGARLIVAGDNLTMPANTVSDFVYHKHQCYHI